MASADSAGGGSCAVKPAPEKSAMVEEKDPAGSERLCSHCGAELPLWSEEEAAQARCPHCNHLIEERSIDHQDLTGDR